jgi:hypothetical protein
MSYVRPISVPRIRFERDSLAIGNEGDQAGLVCAEYPCVHAVQSLDNVGMRMPVAVIAAGGHDGKRRPKYLSERLRRRSAAAMMRHFQYINPAEHSGTYEFSFNLALDVTRHQKPVFAEGDLKHERVVVGSELPRLPVFGGRENID